MNFQLVGYLMIFVGVVGLWVYGRRRRRQAVLAAGGFLVVGVVLSASGLGIRTSVQSVGVWTFLVGACVMLWFLGNVSGQWGKSQWILFLSALACTIVGAVLTGIRLVEGVA